MKLAEVASGGQQWNFENLPEEPSTPCDETEDEKASNEIQDSYKNGDLMDGDSIVEVETTSGVTSDTKRGAEEMHCNGHEDKLTAGDENQVNNGQQVPEAASDTSKPPPVVSSTAEAKPDPVTEITPDLQVKIADLGNACWVVSIIGWQMIWSSIILMSCLFFRLIISLKTFRHGSIEAWRSF